MIGTIGNLGGGDPCEGWAWYVNPYCMAKTAYQRVTTPTTAEEAQTLAEERTALVQEQQYLQQWEEKFKESPAPQDSGRAWLVPVLGGLALVALIGGVIWYTRRPKRR